MNEGIAGPWDVLFAHFHAVVGRIPRIASVVLLESIKAELDDIRLNVLNLLENHVNSLKISANESQDERHIKDSDIKLPSESEIRSANIETQSDRHITHNANVVPATPDDRSTTTIESIRRIETASVTLPLVLTACPQMSDYGPEGRITSWKELEMAAHVVATMLGINPAAINDARRSLGTQQTAIAIACILERHDTIRSPGAYITDLTRKARQAPFSLEPMLMALVRAKVSPRQGTA